MPFDPSALAPRFKGTAFEAAAFKAPRSSPRISIEEAAHPAERVGKEPRHLRLGDHRRGGAEHTQLGREFLELGLASCGKHEIVTVARPWAVGVGSPRK